MKKLVSLLLTLMFVLMLSMAAFATNGDNLIGVGPISRAMGGVGIASPQDTITSLNANPASLNCSGQCTNYEIDLGATLFIPKVNTSVGIDVNTYNADSAKKVYPIPSLGVVIPINDKWKFGFGAYGLAGLGVNYRNTNIDQPAYYDFSAMYGLPAGTRTYPLSGAQYSQFSLLQISPTISFTPVKEFSIGLAPKINYGMLDFGSGQSTTFGIGGQLGINFRPVDQVSMALVYTTPIQMTYGSLYDFSGTGSKGSLKLEAPQTLAAGISVETLKDVFLIETDVKWINWANADGYKDFDWRDQWVLGVGVQYRPIKGLSLRAGYNYGINPARTHYNFNGSSMVNMQGYTMPTYYYENFRMVGFPAFPEHHITFGLGYEFTKNFAANIGYMHAFAKSTTESGTDMTGLTATLSSTLSEDSVEFGLSWKF
ncbi:MAG: hypothetical protein L7F77_03960 [Candidatus Magnetominusculus sp. LBB02]|nr:hypothetical protein [Candidatus Magnetominusculus sp. LBB02]